MNIKLAHSEPENPIIGEMYYNTHIRKYCIYNGTTWNYIESEPELVVYVELDKEY